MAVDAVLGRSQHYGEGRRRGIRHLYAGGRRCAPSGARTVRSKNAGPNTSKRNLSGCSTSSKNRTIDSEKNSSVHRGSSRLNVRSGWTAKRRLLARRRYLRADPDHRLVAAALEAQ